MDYELEDPDNIFLGRTDVDGVYAEVLQQFNDLGDNALANLEYNISFFRSTHNDRFGGYKYIDASGEELETLLFGQICHSTHGTCLGAAGSYNQMSTVNITHKFTYSSITIYASAHKRQYKRQRTHHPL